MRFKYIIIGFALIGIALLGMAAQQNDYRAYVAVPFIDEDVPTDGSNATMVMKVTYVPMMPGVTYTLTAQPLSVVVDLNKPLTINTKIAQAVKDQGNQTGKNVVKVYVPSYELISP